MKETDIAWAAGLLDGEGSIMIVREKRRGYFSLESQLTNTHYETMKRLAEVVGGFIVKLPLRPNRLPAWRWGAKCQKAAQVLKMLLPYLVTKRAQALLGLRFQNTVSHGAHPGIFGVQPYTAEELAIKEGLYWKVRLLNRPSTKVPIQVVLPPDPS